jgi:hypothetical protein
MQLAPQMKASGQIALGQIALGFENRFPVKEM